MPLGNMSDNMSDNMGRQGLPVHGPRRVYAQLRRFNAFRKFGRQHPPAPVEYNRGHSIRGQWLR